MLQTASVKRRSSQTHTEYTRLHRQTWIDSMLNYIKDDVNINKNRMLSIACTLCGDSYILYQYLKKWRNEYLASKLIFPSSNGFECSNQTVKYFGTFNDSAQRKFNGR